MKTGQWRLLATLCLVGILATISGCPAVVTGDGGGGGTDNTNDNGTENTNDSGADNTNDNGTDNTNDNGVDNTNDNGVDNTNDNGAENTNENGTDNTNDNAGDGDPTATLTVVKTGIGVRSDKRILAGDDIIVFGTGPFAGVDFMVPSAGDRDGRGIPGGGSFVANGFAVAGKKIALQKNFQVTIYDTAGGTSETIGLNEIRLTNSPSGQYDPGHIMADGHYFIVRSNSSTDDGLFVKVIDVTGAVPVVISFAVNPDEDAFSVDHVMIDADTRTAVAAANDSFFVYDIDAPADAPVEFAIPDGISDTVPRLDGNFIIFGDDLVSGNACTLELSTGTITILTANPSAKELALAGGSFGYFVDMDSLDSLGNAQRSAIGPLDGIPGADLAAVQDFIDGNTTNNGALGYGETMAITGDGSLWFIAGAGEIGSGEYLQVSDGGAFGLFEDPIFGDTYGCPATDVSVSSNTVAFKVGNATSTRVGYIILP